MRCASVSAPSYPTYMIHTLRPLLLSFQGDSIIVGFHTPLDALQAAMAAQEGLLAADWPIDLLGHPLCVPQFAAPASTSASAGQASQGQPTTWLMPVARVALGV
jgi:hypothetical protein